MVRLNFPAINPDKQEHRAVAEQGGQPGRSLFTCRAGTPNVTTQNNIYHVPSHLHGNDERRLPRSLSIGSDPVLCFHSAHGQWKINNILIYISLFPAQHDSTRPWGSSPVVSLCSLLVLPKRTTALRDFPFTRISCIANSSSPNLHVKPLGLSHGVGAAVPLGGH